MTHMKFIEYKSLLGGFGVCEEEPKVVRKVERMERSMGVRMEGLMFQHVVEGDLEGVRGLLARDSFLVTARMQGFTPLILAAQEGHEHIVRELLLHGARLDDRSPDGFSALLHAAQGGHSGVCEESFQGFKERSQETFRLSLIKANENVPCKCFASSTRSKSHRFAIDSFAKTEQT